MSVRNVAHVHVHTKFSFEKVNPDSEELPSYYPTQYARQTWTLLYSPISSPYGSTPAPGGFVNPAPLPPSSQASYGFNPNPDQGTAYSTPANFMIPAQPDLPANMMTPAQFQPSPPSGSSSVMQREPAPPKEKGPIPPEHQEIHDVFENLRTKCLASANHPVSNAFIILRSGCEV